MKVGGRAERQGGGRVRSCDVCGNQVGPLARMRSSNSWSWATARIASYWNMASHMKGRGELWFMSTARVFSNRGSASPNKTPGAADVIPSVTLLSAAAVYQTLHRHSIPTPAHVLV